MSEVIIIGAGAAGILASAECAKNGNRVTVVEKMSRPCRKVMITGKGRCNITNAVFEVGDLIENIPTNGRFLYSAFSNFMPYDTIALLESMGVSTKIERGNRVFPQSDKAAHVVDALVRYAADNGVVFKTGEAEAFDFEDGKISAVILKDSTRLLCDKVAVCTGGVSYPLTGSTGDGYRLAESVGHTIVPIRPALVPLDISNGFIPRLQGLSLKNISVTLLKDGKKIYSDFGEMLFTHFGVSGPVILSASSHINSFDDSAYTLMLDLKPALDEVTLDKRIQRDFADAANKDFINSLAKLLPKKMVPVIVSLSSIEPSQKVNQITKEQRKKLVHTLKNIRLDVAGFRPVEEAIVTGGGVNVREVDPKTMCSKIMPNLYFAGEVLDLDAYTGGFNLQIAFSTGVLCGQSM